VISSDSIEYPDYDRFNDPAAYLFQLGYLSLRPCDSEDDYLLDYPNVEVRQSLARVILENYCETDDRAPILCPSIMKALLERNPTFLIDELNKLFATIPHEYYEQKWHIDPIGRDEGFYCAQIFLLFYSLNLNFHSEKHERLGRADFVVHAGTQTWVIEVKVSHNESTKNKRKYGELTDDEAIKEFISTYVSDEIKANKNLALELLNNKDKYDALMEKARELAANIQAGKVGLDALGQSGKLMATKILAGKEASLAMVGQENESMRHGDTVLPTDQKLADAAFEQIINKSYADQYDNPVILAIVINDNSRKITAYKQSDGFPKKLVQETNNDEPRGPRLS
jgi:hypothetical protein